MFNKRKLLKESFGHGKVCITLDYPKEIQKERAVLIKAMKKAQEAGTRAKVLGRSLVMSLAHTTRTQFPKHIKTSV